MRPDGGLIMPGQWRCRKDGELRELQPVRYTAVYDNRPDTIIKTREDIPRRRYGANHTWALLWRSGGAWPTGGFEIPGGFRNTAV